MLTPKSVIRASCDRARAGYRLTHSPAVLPFGVDPVLDIQRLAARRGDEVRWRSICDIGDPSAGGDGAGLSGGVSRGWSVGMRSRSVAPRNSFACVAELQSERLHAHRLALSNRCGEAEFFVFSELAGDPDAPVAASMNNSLVAETQFEVALAVGA